MESLISETSSGRSNYIGEYSNASGTGKPSYSGVQSKIDEIIKTDTEIIRQQDIYNASHAEALAKLSARSACSGFRAVQCRDRLKADQNAAEARRDAAQSAIANLNSTKASLLKDKEDALLTYKTALDVWEKTTSATDPDLIAAKSQAAIEAGKTAIQQAEVDAATGKSKMITIAVIIVVILVVAGGIFWFIKRKKG